jgi:hypothetical protein
MAWFVLVTGAGSVCAQCLFPSWQQLSPAQSPAGQRFFHQMTYDSKRGTTVLFGGADKCYVLCEYPADTDVYDDTWEFDGKTWTQRFPSTTPFRLVGASMSYDPVKGVSIMFGGVVGANGIPSSSVLWEWDGNDWQAVPSVSPHPKARYGHKMVYDSARRVHVMYGGSVYSRPPGYSEDIALPVTETWDYDAPARTWTLRSTNGPGGRFGFDLAYDPVRNQTVLFGGELETAPTLADAYANDTWVWDGGAGNWQQLNPANKPSGRFGHAMAFDSTRGVVVLLGGEYVAVNYTNSIVPALSSETWEWDGANWVKPRFAYNFCCGISRHAMVYESARQQLFIFADTGRTYDDPMLNWVAATGNGRSINYVDWSNFSFLEDGSISFPFRTLRNAVSCTLGAATISIRGGDYAEGFQQITKQMSIIANNGPAHIH